MKTKEKKILYDSPEAAKHVKNIEGWVSADGRFFGKDKHMARWDGYTHTICECGGHITKGWTVCGKCREKKEWERYEKLEKKKWDGETPLYSETYDKYIFSECDIEFYSEDFDCKIEDMRLFICEPNYLHPIESDYWTDILPEDIEDLPSDVESALEELNKVIKEADPVSWSPGKYAVELPL